MRTFWVLWLHERFKMGPCEAVICFSASIGWFWALRSGVSLHNLKRVLGETMHRLQGCGAKMTTYSALYW